MEASHKWDSLLWEHLELRELSASWLEQTWLISHSTHPLESSPKENHLPLRWSGDLDSHFTLFTLHTHCYRKNIIGAGTRGGHFEGYFKAASNFAERKLCIISVPELHADFRHPPIIFYMKDFCMWRHVDITSFTTLRFSLGRNDDVGSSHC